MAPMEPSFASASGTGASSPDLLEGLSARATADPGPGGPPDPALFAAP